jgi:hypothetical protein
MREALPIMRRLCAENNVVGVELVEIRPDSDPGYTTNRHESRPERPEESTTGSRLLARTGRTSGALP